MSKRDLGRKTYIDPPDAVPHTDDRDESPGVLLGMDPIDGYETEGSRPGHVNLSRRMFFLSQIRHRCGVGEVGRPDCLKTVVKGRVTCGTGSLPLRRRLQSYPDVVLGVGTDPERPETRPRETEQKTGPGLLMVTP